MKIVMSDIELELHASKCIQLWSDFGRFQRAGRCPGYYSDIFGFHNQWFSRIKNTQRFTFRYHSWAGTFERIVWFVRLLFC